MRSLLPLASLALLFVAGCVPSPAVRAPAPPRPVPAPTPTPAPLPQPVPTASDWRDWPLTPGDWVYRQDGRGSIALFGPAGQPAQVMLRCDRARGRVYLSRPGAAPATLTIRTTSAVRAVQAVPAGGTPPYVSAEFGTRDPLLDAMGFSRGRFLIEGGGGTLTVPAWPEILRVVEDCRG